MPPQEERYVPRPGDIVKVVAHPFEEGSSHVVDMVVVGSVARVSPAEEAAWRLGAK